MMCSRLLIENKAPCRRRCLLRYRSALCWTGVWNLTGMTRNSM